MTSNQIWIIDDDKSIRWVLEKALQKAGMETICYEDANTIMQNLAEEQPAAIVTDIRMPGINGLELLNKINSKYPSLPVIIMTAHSDLESAVSAYQGGAFEYLPKPFDIDDAVDMVRRAIELQSSASDDKEADVETISTEIIGAAPAMQEVFRAIGRLARSNINVLINGDSGTGKELVARALHRHSPRVNKEFIAINTAAIPKDLLESELFGHEKGAFTGAHNLYRGRFEQADGGTLFLDEIGDMPSELQTRLLRVLAEGEFFRVGGRNAIKVDVRIIAATHQNLEQLVQEKRFREDLFHRLNVIRIHVPRLKDRREDIVLLMNHFLAIAAKELNAEVKILHDDTIKILEDVEWPGNVRQLENICRWLTVMAPGQEVLPDDLPPEIHQSAEQNSNISNWQEALESVVKQRLDSGEQEILNTLMPDIERVLIHTALKHSGGRKQDAAKLLGWGRNTLTRKVKELDID